MQRYGYDIERLVGSQILRLRFLVRVSEKSQSRYQVLRFWEKYGPAPPLEAASDKACGALSLALWRNTAHRETYNEIVTRLIGSVRRTHGCELRW